MNKLSNLFVIVAVLSLTACFYDSKSNVVKLNSSNFHKEVTNSKDIWLIEFYAPWCGHCQRLTPEWEKTATALKGIFKIGAIDADSEKQLGAQFGIQGFPTIKFFGADKGRPEDYNGGRTANEITSFFFKKAKEIAKKRLNGNSSGSSSNKKAEDSKQKAKGPSSDKDVVVLDDSNFNELVLKSKDMWLVEFYAPWCGHCMKLEPEWNQAATQLKGKVKLGKLNAEQNKQIASKYGVRGFPTIRIFPPGNKSSSEEWDGPREASGIVSTALEKLEKFGYVPDVAQLTNEDQLKESCKDRVGICIVAFLPHIEFSSAKERRTYLEMLKEVSLRFKF